MKASEEVLAKIAEFKSNTEATDKMIVQIEASIAKFEKRAKAQDAKMIAVTRQVEDYTLGFTNRIDRVIKDFHLRFSDLTKVNNQL